MPVFRVEKTKNYTVMGNYHFSDRSLSLEAVGLLSFMLSLPEDWNYSLNGLVAIRKEGIKKIRSTLKELQEYGYLTINKKQKANGRFEYEYLIYEIPHTPKGYVDEGDMDKGTQINTNKESINNKDKLDKSLCNLTEELIKRNFISRDDIELYSYDSFLNSILEKYSYKECAIVISYVISKLKNKNDILNKYGYFKQAVLNNLSNLKNSDLPKWLNETYEIKEPTEEEKRAFERYLDI